MVGCSKINLVKPKIKKQLKIKVKRILTVRKLLQIKNINELFIWKISYLKYNLHE
jgi:hypothetical protein